MSNEYQQALSRIKSIEKQAEEHWNTLVQNFATTLISDLRRDVRDLLSEVRILTKVIESVNQKSMVVMPTPKVIEEVRVVMPDPPVEQDVWSSCEVNDAKPEKNGVEDDLVSIRTAATLLKMHRNTVRNLAIKGSIPYKKIGSQFRFSRRQLLHLDSQSVSKVDRCA